MRTLFINALTAIAMAIVLEVLVIYALSNPATIPDFLLTHFKTYYANSDRNIIQVTDCAEYDPDFYYRLKPNGTCTFYNREFSVENHFNSAGLRDDESSLDNPSIVMLGDSFTMGWGVPQTDAFPQVLEALSQKKVLNAGVSSFGTAREVKLLETLTRRRNLKHVETVIFQYHHNDFEENLQSIENNFVLPISPRHLYDSIKEYIADRNRYFPFKCLAKISKSILESNFRPEPPVPNDTLEARAFLEILRHSNIRNLASRIVVFKIDSNGNNNRFVDAVDNLMMEPEYAGLNVRTVRLNGVLTADDYFILDLHTNSQGSAKIAAVLWNDLKPEEPLMVADKITVSNTANQEIGE